jgi:hypothetical protein
LGVACVLKLADYEALSETVGATCPCLHPTRCVPGCWWRTRWAGWPSPGRRT